MAKALTHFRKQLLKLADGTRTIDQIADQVTGYSHYYYGPGKPHRDIVLSTLSQMRKNYPSISWLAPKTCVRKRPSDKMMQRHLEDWKNGRVTQGTIARKYNASRTSVSKWLYEAAKGDET